MQTSFPSPRASLIPVAVSVALWCLGSALTPWLGIWGGVGGAALLLGAAFTRTYSKALLPLWRCQHSDVIVGVAAGILMIAATYLLFPVVAALFPALPPRTRELYHLFNSGSPVYRILLPLVILGEELVWRGVVQAALTRRLGIVAGAIVTALVYGTAHLPLGAPLLAAVAFCCGLYWGLIRARSGSLVPGLLSHFMWDLVVMICLPLVR